MNSDAEEPFPVAPQRALIDTGVLIRALGDRPTDLATGSCKSLWQVLQRHKTEILVAAPTIAEMLRSSVKTQVPRTRHIEVVAFDQTAAFLLAEKLPLTVLQTEMRPGEPAGYIKYDALIVACAARHRAGTLISVDERMLKLARAVGLAAYAPSHYDRLASTGE